MLGIAKWGAKESKFTKTKQSNDKSEIFEIARKKKDRKKDTIKDKCVRNENGKLSMPNEEKQQVWKFPVKPVLNKEFKWYEEQLPKQSTIQGPPILAKKHMVAKITSKTKSGKAVGQYCITVEMIKAADNEIMSFIKLLINQIITDGKNFKRENHHST